MLDADALNSLLCLNKPMSCQIAHPDPTPGNTISYFDSHSSLLPLQSSLGLF
jgi:hypothetical protein